MKTFRKIVALLFCMILVTTHFTALADTNDPNVFYSTFNVTLHQNAAFSKYGVTVYFDDIEVAYLNQGDVLTFGAYMTDDQAHVLRFDPDKKGVSDRIWTISNLQNGSSLTCEIQTKRNQVKIKSQSLNQNGQTIFSVSPDIAAQVKLVGTIIVTGIKIYQAGQ